MHAVDYPIYDADQHYYEPPEAFLRYLPEGFEHRSVCYDVYNALYGKGIRSYLYRLYGFVYAIAHIGSSSIRSP